MKYLLICILFLGANATHAQIQQTLLLPMNEIEFKQRYNQMVSMPGGDEAKLKTFRYFITNRSLSSKQVKQFATTIINDAFRYELALSAFAVTTDKENFYEVYDAFATFSTVFRLHDAIHAFAPTPSPAHPPKHPQQPNITYPSCNNYIGKKGCAQPLSNGDFNFYAATYFLKNNDDERINEARELAKRYCISMEQFMRMALAFNLDNNRMAFMKETFPRIFDLENYNFATAVFDNEFQRSEWIGFARNILKQLTPQLPPPPPPAPACTVSQNELDEVKTTIAKQSLSRTMVAVGKQAIQAKKCFSSKQIIQIVRLYSFDKDQLDMAKFAYDFTTDKENFYTVANALSFTSSKENLMQFIDSRK
ncbi:MAG: DUF4476 domain-containing protein [Chitinophagales bacterium]